MPRIQDPDEEELEEESEEEVVKPTKKRKTEAKAEPAKKGGKAAAKAEPKAKAKEAGAEIGTKQVTSDGRPCVDLSEYKRVTINEFKGAMLIDIRETYKDKASGDMKPGKKGISLNLDQWNALKNNIELIDELLGEAS